MSGDAMAVKEVSPDYMLTTAKPAVPAGYKNTDAGVIPTDWEVKRLGDIAGFRTGPFGSALHKSDYVTDGVPVINPMHIIDGQLVPTTTMSISEDAAKKLADFRLQLNDIVIGRRGDMGRCGVVRSAHSGWLCGTGSMIVKPTTKAYPDFLQRILSSSAIISKIESSSVGSTMINLNQATLSNLPVQCPTVEEQRAIATALSDVDALLEELDRLIAKKRDLKQATMQQLLTGQTRLPGFEGEWRTVELGEIGSFFKGSGVKREQSQSGHLPCVRYGEIYTDHNDVIRSFRSWISENVAESAVRIRKGDLLFAGSGETRAEIGKCVALVDDLEAYAGGDIVVLRPLNADPIFLGYLLNLPSVSQQKSRLGQGDAVVHISANALSKVTIAVPDKQEQEAIGEMISGMDSEIAALEQRRTKTARIKQAMMQELLTGRTRLV